MMTVIIVVVSCLSITILAACVLRRGGVRGSLRAGPVHFGIEIDASPPNEPSEPKKLP